MSEQVPTKDLVSRITAYLAGGGLFNPELANHDAVRDLLIACRDALAAPERPAAAPAMPGELARHIERKFMVAVMEADDAFQKAGATGTKTWIRDFLLGRLEANGLGIGMKEHLRATQPPGDG